MERAEWVGSAKQGMEGDGRVRKPFKVIRRVLIEKKAASGAAESI